MSNLYIDLAWLRRPPADFKSRCEALALEVDLNGTAAKQLATYALDVNNLTRLAKIIRPRVADAKAVTGLSHFRLGLLSNGTTNFVADAVVATGPRFGLAIEVIEPAFDQVTQEALQPDSALRRAKLDAVLVALDHRALRLHSGFGDSGEAEATITRTLAHLRALCAGFRDEGVTCIVQTLVPPPEPVFGNLDLIVCGTVQQMVEELNRRIRIDFSSSGMVVLDVAVIASMIGTSEWHDPTQWAIAKLPCAMRAVPLYADQIARVIGALRGQSRRVLVLDLDNTVWSGVIGDDGLHGIVIGQGDPVGEAHLELQRYALLLRERGVVLAVSSKNEDVTARLPFREHPDMLLKESHFAVFQANWSDKASNIEAIATALDLTLASFVFVDDNPAERELVRSKLPAVAVPELPDDPAYYVRTISAAGYFESVAFSSEDRQRVGFYENNARRLELQTVAGSLQDYLRSLQMKITFAPFDHISRARISQLINKSNQFNLTTRRYSELDIEQFEKDETAFTLQVRLSDVFGDNGLISVIICREIDDIWSIDTWLMSCRVLKRKVEEAVLQEMIRKAKMRGVRELRGTFIPSGRNTLVVDHFRDLGFLPVVPSGPDEVDGTTHWRYSIEDAEELDLPMEVTSL